jgi:drug/metabolite transporter (DMT)-like permease
VALLGVIGAAGALTTIRWIGRRAHPLISVNYFSVWCTLVSTVALSTASHLPEPFTQPDLRFKLPVNLRQWALMFMLGICGFIMQFLLTAGVSHEKSNRATNMIYTNMLFALLFDRLIFGTVPGLWSLLGSGLILGSAVYVAVNKSMAPSNEHSAAGGVVGGVPDEEVGMLQDIEGEEDVVPLREIVVQDDRTEATETAVNGEVVSLSRDSTV